MRSSSIVIGAREISVHAILTIVAKNFSSIIIELRRRLLLGGQTLAISGWSFPFPAGRPSVRSEIMLVRKFAIKVLKTYTPKTNPVLSQFSCISGFFRCFVITLPFLEVFLIFLLIGYGIFLAPLFSFKTLQWHQQGERAIW